MMLILLIWISQIATEQRRIGSYYSNDTGRVKCNECILTIARDTLFIKTDESEVFAVKGKFESKGRVFYLMNHGFLMISGNFAVLESKKELTKYYLKKERP